MPPRYGTLSVQDTLAAYNEASVLDVGEETINGFVRQILDGYNALVGDMVADLVGFTTERETTYGIDSSTGEMVDLDEYGLADAQKFPFAPSAVGFPLRRKGATLQWTRDYLARTTPAELGRQTLGITEADTRAIYSAMRRALFNPANNTTYVDRLVDNRTFAIRGLANGDGQAIPPQPVTGTTFDGATHNHYLGTASFVEANLVSLIDTVFEHWDGVQGQVRVYINRAQETAVRGFAGFNAYVDPRIVYETDTNRAAETVDLINVNDRTIGFYGVAEVDVKPWIPANYLLAFIDGAGDEAEPVLRWRRPDRALAQEADLRIVADLDRHPLHARAYSRLFGIAAHNRVRAAALFIGNATFQAFAG